MPTLDVDHTTNQSAPPRRSRAGVRAGTAFVLALVLLALTIVMAAGMGTNHYSARQVLRAAMHGPPTDTDVDADDVVVTVWLLRLPRILLAALVGGSLAAAGVALQCLLRNDLSDPYVIGVSSGASVGAEAVLMRHADDKAHGFAVPIAAFAAGLATIGAVYAIARRGGQVQVRTMLLAGVIVSSFLGAVSTLLLELGNPSDSFHILMRLMGSLQDASLDNVRWVGGILVLALVALSTQASAMNVFALGEEQAAQLGVEVERFKTVMITASAMLTAASVAFAGVIGFVGLVVPHMTRRIAGTPDHRRVLPLATVLGAILLVWADTIARSIMHTAQELPVGVVTAFVGAPFFCYLLRRRMSTG